MDTWSDKMSIRPLKQAVPGEPLDTEPEGRSAAWFREKAMRLSRPALARKLGISAKTVEREENRERVSTEYRLACAALALGLENWSWGKNPARPILYEVRSGGREVHLRVDAPFNFELAEKSESRR